MNKFYKQSCWIVLLCLLAACSLRTGDPSAFVPPTTKLFLSSIALDSANSLSGLVRLYWSGEAPTGFVKYFEFYTDSNTCNISSLPTDGWQATTRTDSAFLFRIPAGKSIDRISFYVRAVDNHDLKDLNPPCLEVPVKNTPPTVAFNKLYNSKSITDTVHLTFTMSFTASDVDGADNIDSVYIRLNASKWVAFPSSVDFITFIPANPKSTDSTTCSILLSNQGRTSKTIIPGLKLETKNKIYVKAKDISRSFSKSDSASFYCKSQKSDLLLIDAFKGNSERTIYGNAIRSVYTAGLDYYDFYRQNTTDYVPLYWNLAFAEYLKFYKKIFWFDDNNTSGGQYTLESGSAAIQTFQNNGGKILISIKQLPNDPGSSLLSLVPYDSLSKDVGQGQIYTNLKINPVQLGYDTLQANDNIAPVTTMYVKTTSKILYTANVNPVNGWVGPNNIAAYTLGNDGKANLIFFSVPIHVLNKNTTSFKNLFDRILNTEF